MKKIAIATWYIGYNLGAVLQAYALNKYLNDMDSIISVEIQYIEHSNDVNSSTKEIIKQLLHGHGIRSLVPRLKMVHLCKKKKSLIDKFRCCYIRQTNPIVDRSELTRLNEQYDTFICGSDQIWNPSFLNSAYMFNYTNDTKARISYAASLGVYEWPNSKRKEAIKLLNRFSHISVREKASVGVIKNLTDVEDIEHVCDPVLLLKKHEWKKLAKNIGDEIKKIVSHKYLFCYILNKNRKQMELIKNYAKWKSLMIVNIAHPAGEYCKADKGFGDVKLQAITPQEFVALNQHADVIFTDSFHCVMFSLIFGREFFCFKRQDYPEMNIRVESILQSVKLENRAIVDNNTVNTLANLAKTNYESVQQLLSEYRTHSVNWLGEAI